ncbi:hypothetical protein Tco_0394588 [Tanacetum coccineum]
MNGTTKLWQLLLDPPYSRYPPATIQEIKVQHRESIDVSFVYESIEVEHKKQDTSSRSGNDADTDNAYIKPIYDEEPMAENRKLSLLANNADLKAQIQEKIFAIAALKNDLRKLRGNSVDTKFAKTSVLGKPVLQSLRNQSVVRQPNAFKSERPQMSKPRFASQVDMNHNLSRPVAQHYFPKRSESAFSKPNHMIASSSSRNSSKNLPRLSSNDMVHNHYLDEARKKTQERDRNSKTSVMPSARFQSTADDSKPKPRSTNHSLGVPTGKILASCTSKDDSEPTHGSNVDIPNIHECKQTLDLSAGTKVDIYKIIYSDLVTKLTNKSRHKSSPTISSNSNFSKDPSKVTPIELTDFMIAINNHENSVNPLPFTVKKKKGKSQTDVMAQESDDKDVLEAREDMEEDTYANEEEHQSPPPNQVQPESSHAQESASDSSSLELKK